MTEPVQPQRHHAIDALRTGALVLLIVYHATCYFQPWAKEMGVPVNNELLPEIWPPFEMLNIWRIPILFVVSGMGVRFAMERRTNRELLKERSLRILLPFVFGFFTLGALCVALDQYGTGKEIRYEPHQYHLWFLGNIYLYAVLMLPVLRHIMDHPDGPLMRATRWLLRTAWFPLVLALPGVVEVWLIQPEHYAGYPESLHALVLGAICFFIGFVCASNMDEFREGTLRLRWWITVVALALYGARFAQHFENTPLTLTALESMLWMMAIFGHAFAHCSFDSPKLRYANTAVYPVYILHEPITIFMVIILAQQPLTPWLKWPMVILATLGGSLLIYASVVSRVRWLRPLFGLRMKA